MIAKPFEIEKKAQNSNFFLFHGSNEGHKNYLINQKFKRNKAANIYTYYEKDILSNLENFYNNIFSSSLFEKTKIIIIKDASDKLKNIIEEIKLKELTDITIILIAKILEKKSKLRNFFEKDKSLVSVVFYPDNGQTLALIAKEFLKKKNISSSSEVINHLVNKCNGEREFLLNELKKIEMYAQNKKKISLEEINILTNIIENNDVNELADNCLAKNNKKIFYILNENNFSSEDTIMIVRVLLSKMKRLYNLINNYNIENNLEKTISSAKPPIFWKDKEIVKKQIKSWKKNQIIFLIEEVNKIELILKSNPQNSIPILLNFILKISKTSN